jgi:hypothetical protein
MNCSLSQVYVEPGVNFKFTTVFQRKMKLVLSSSLEPSALFIKKYSNYSLHFWMSARIGIPEPEIKGPGIYRRTKDVEYSIFLPHSGVPQPFDRSLATPLNQLFSSIANVLSTLQIDSRVLTAQVPALIDEVLSDSTMYEMSK